jgi:AcrR family transcriptional regulator
MPTIPLTRERIVEEAIALVDTDGASALSMRRLAARLGTSTMSTYHHIPDKQALREAIAERVMSDLAEPDPALPWDEALRELAWSFRSLTLAHPAVFQLLLDTPRPAALGAAAESTIKRLIRAGFSTDQAVLVFRTMIRYLLGVVAIEADIPPDAEHDATFAYGIEALLRGIGAHVGVVDLT